MQRYITADEEKDLLVEAFCILDSDSKSLSEKLRRQAFEIKCQRFRNVGQYKDIQKIRPPGKNWPNQFLERYQEALQIEKIESLGWRRKSSLPGDGIADLAALPSEVRQLCPECAAIKAKLMSLLVRAQPNESRRVHIFKGPLLATGTPPCKLCQFVMDCSKSWSWPSAVKYSLNAHHMENVLGPTLTESKLLLSLAIEDEYSKGEYRGWIIPTLLGQTSKIDRLGWGSVHSSVNFVAIKEWVDFCDCNHLDGCGSYGVDDIPFFRLIDCASRLIIDAPADSKFAALSYRWKPGENPQDNPSELPRDTSLVIEDALEAAARLAIPYLWVDRYCITQHKDSPTKPIQLQNMHKVYRSAHITLIAGAGDDPTFGLPGVSSRARKPPVSVDTHGHRLVLIPDIVQEIQNCNWSTRGWTLQENLLSRRRLVFTKTQAYFQCWHMHCCEAIPTCLDRAHTKDLTRFKDFTRRFRVFPQKGIGKTGVEIETRIQEYLGRHLTEQTDALNAFLGILQAFRELDHPIENFWGLPMSRFAWVQGAAERPNESSEVDELRASFLSSLAWSNDVCHRTKAHALVRRQGFPSWTWAAWQGLRTFSRKSIVKDPQSPSVGFRSRQDQRIELGDYELFLGSSNSVMLFEPCILLSGWVANVWFSEEHFGEDEAPTFQIQRPIPTHRVSMAMDANIMTQFRRNLASQPFPLLLLGGESSQHDPQAVPHGWKDVHAVVLQELPDGTHMRLGVVTWSLLGRPTINESQNAMRVKELLEARRVIPGCQCGCLASADASFDRYLEDDRYVMEFKKGDVRLV